MLKIWYDYAWWRSGRQGVLRVILTARCDSSSIGFWTATVRFPGPYLCALHSRNGCEIVSSVMQELRKPRLGETNLGSLAGAVIAAIGSLFAVGIAHAIVERDLAMVFATPLVAVLCWLASWPVGWLLGGQVGPRLAQKVRHPRAELVGGALAGLVPVFLVGLWAYYMASH
jgi:hypothetical protein